MLIDPPPIFIPYAHALIPNPFLIPFPILLNLLSTCYKSVVHFLVPPCTTLCSPRLHLLVRLFRRHPAFPAPKLYPYFPVSVLSSASHRAPLCFNYYRVPMRFLTRFLTFLPRFHPLPARFSSTATDHNLSLWLRLTRWTNSMCYYCQPSATFSYHSWIILGNFSCHTLYYRTSYSCKISSNLVFKFLHPLRREFKSHRSTCCVSFLEYLS